MRAKKVTVKPTRFSRPPRGKGGRFVSASKLRGEDVIPNFIAVAEESGFRIARKYTRGMAEMFREELVERILRQNVPKMGGLAHGKPRRFDQPLHPFTLREKAAAGQDHRTMIADGSYIGAIRVIEERIRKGHYIYRVGFSGEEHRSGLSFEHLGRIQEYGCKIRVTKKMRAYLHYRGLHLKNETRFITIPARPHWMPTWLRFRRQKERLQRWGTKNLLHDLKQELRSAR